MVAYTAKGFRIFTPRRTNILIAGRRNHEYNMQAKIMMIMTTTTTTTTTTTLKTQFVARR